MELELSLAIVATYIIARKFFRPNIKILGLKRFESGKIVLWKVSKKSLFIKLEKLLPVLAGRIWLSSAI